MTNKNFEKNDRLPGIHGLRAIAAFSVVIFHVHGIHKLELPQSFSIIKTHFGLGVYLFFVLSAFSLFVSTQNRVGKVNWIQDYFIRRFFRIAPLFYLMIIVWYLFTKFEFNQLTPFNDMLFNFLFIFNFIPGKQDSIVWAGWTIGVEIVFYALIPAMLVYIRNTRLALALFILGSLITIAARITYDSYAGIEILQNYSHHAFLSQFGIFCAGIAAYFLYWRRNTYPHWISNKIFYNSISIFSVILMIVLIFMPTESLIKFGRADILAWALAFALLASAQAVHPWLIIANKPTFYAGEHSFSIYLIHPIIIYNLGPIYSKIYLKIGSNFGISFIICVFITLIILLPVAAIIYALIESPGMKIGRWLICHNRGIDRKEKTENSPGILKKFAQLSDSDKLTQDYN